MSQNTPKKSATANQYRTVTPVCILKSIGTDTDKPITLKRGFCCDFLKYIIQHCCICRHSDSTVSEEVEIEPRTVPTSELAVRRFSHWTRSHPQTDNLTAWPYLCCVRKIFLNRMMLYFFVVRLCHEICLV